MLGSKGVHDGQPFGDILRDDNENAVAVDDTLDERTARQRLRLREDFRANPLGERGGRADAKRLFVAGAMFGLRQEVGRDPPHVHRPVGEDGDLARPRDLVDRDVAVDLALRRRDEGVAGARDLLDLAARLRAERQKANRLDAADAVDFGRARELEREEEDGVDPAVLPGGRAGDDFPHARRLRKRDGHDGRRGERRRAARHVDADAVHRREELAGRTAARRLHRPRPAERRLREREDAAVRVLHGPHELRVNPLLGDRCEIDAQALRRARPEALELRDEIQDGAVAARADVGKRGGGGLLGLFGERRTRVERRDPPVARLDDPNHLYPPSPIMHLTEHSTAGSPFASGSPFR